MTAAATTSTEAPAHARATEREGPATPRGRAGASRMDAGTWMIGVLASLKLVVHLALAGEYGWHRDELYFVECGEHLAFGYVDHAPLVPWLARLVTELFGTNLVALRVLPAFAGAATVVLAGLLARELGGGRFAQGLAALGVLAAPVYWRTAIMLDIVVFEPVFWSAGALLVARILRGGSPRLWLVVGLVAGVGLLNKHTMLLWGAGLVAGLLLTRARRLLATPWPWAGGLVATVVFAPNLVWQATHGWPTVEFARNMSEGLRDDVPTAAFLAGQALYMHPVAVPLWVAGLAHLLGRHGEAHRALGWQFVAVAAILLVTAGKPYYLAPAYPVLFAAGGIAVERWSRAARRVYAGALVVTGAAFALVSLPLLSLSTVDAVLDTLFGWFVPPIALTHDLHDEFGWHEQVETVAAVYGSLTPDEQATATIVTGNYGEASAVNVLGRGLDLPRAVTGHMTHHLWGPDTHRAGPVIAYGLPPDQLDLFCNAPTEVARHHHPVGRVEENVSIFLCRSPQRTPADVWDTLRRYGHAYR